MVSVTLRAFITSQWNIFCLFLCKSKLISWKLLLPGLRRQLIPAGYTLDCGSKFLPVDLESAGSPTVNCLFHIFFANPFFHPLKILELTSRGLGIPACFDSLFEDKRAVHIKRTTFLYQIIDFCFLFGSSHSDHLDFIWISFGNFFLTRLVFFLTSAYYF